MSAWVAFKEIGLSSKLANSRLARANRVPWLARSIAVLTLGLATTSARADIVTYSDGTVIKGLTRELPGATDMIELTCARGTLRVPRSRVARIESESPTMGWIHIGDDLRQSERWSDAIAAYKKAGDLEPANADAKSRIDQAQAALAQIKSLNRQENVKKIDDLANQAMAAFQKSDFEKSEQLYKQANDLVPDPAQKAKLAMQISQLNLAWGRERLDKLDTSGAEAKFNLAVQAAFEVGKDNSEAISELLKLWEKANSPEKREQAARIYETILERHPEDSDMRKTLGDLYAQMGRTEEMVYHYGKLYAQGDKWRGSTLERKLADGLRKLQSQYASQKNYDQAIKTFKLLATIDATADPATIVYYEYLKMSNTLKPTDLRGRLELAQYAEKNGMEQQALDAYHALFGAPETHDVALAALTRYAQRDFAMATENFNRHNWGMAITLAQQTRKDYPEVSALTEPIAELIGKAQVENVNAQRQTADQAKDLVKAGDEYYAEAEKYFQNLFSTERTHNSYLISDRSESARYYRLAIQSYQEALRINPQLASGKTSLINVRLAQATRNLNRLTNPTFNYGVGRGTSKYNSSSSSSSN